MSAFQAILTGDAMQNKVLQDVVGRDSVARKILNLGGKCEYVSWGADCVAAYFSLRSW